MSVAGTYPKIYELKEGDGVLIRILSREPDGYIMSFFDVYGMLNRETNHVQIVPIGRKTI